MWENKRKIPLSFLYLSGGHQLWTSSQPFHRKCKREQDGSHGSTGSGRRRKTQKHGGGRTPDNKP